MITQARLKEVLNYDPLTGIFAWIKKTCRKVVVGAVAGHVADSGYVFIRIFGRLYRAHRLAYLFMTGEFPLVGIDHENTDKGDNRWLNLRPATKSQNAMNADAPSNNTSGVRGVSWDSRDQKWHAYIAKDGKRINLGYFTKRETAAMRRRRAEEKLFGEFARAA